MTGREIVLNSLSKVQLLEMKTLFLRAVRDSYADDEIPANDETIENFILYLAYEISGALMMANLVFLTVLIPAFYKKFEFGLTMFFILLLGNAIFMIHTRFKRNIKINTQFALMVIYLKMRLHRIKTPWIA